LRIVARNISADPSRDAAADPPSLPVHGRGLIEKAEQSRTDFCAAMTKYGFARLALWRPRRSVTSQAPNNQENNPLMYAIIVLCIPIRVHGISQVRALPPDYVTMLSKLSFAEEKFYKGRCNRCTAITYDDTFDHSITEFDNSTLTNV
jgi:hypothetical protein